MVECLRKPSDWLEARLGAQAQAKSDIGPYKPLETTNPGEISLEIFAQADVGIAYALVTGLKEMAQQG